MLKNIAELPALKMLIPFIAGVLLYNSFELDPYVIFSLWSFLLFVSIVFNYLKPEFQLKFQLFHGFTIFFLILFFALILRSNVDHQKHEGFYENFPNGNKTVYKATIKEIGKTANGYRLVVKPEYFIKKKVKHRTCGKLSLFIKDDDLKASEYDEIYFSASFDEPQDPANPNSFSFKKYLENKNIVHTAFLAGDEYLVVAGNSLISRFYKVIFKIREYSDNSLSKYLSNKNFTIARSLILGNRDELEDKTRSIFTETGTMHVLAVSGLHVGIIYLLLHFALGKLLLLRYGGTLKALVIIIIIWLFACLTGLSASVIRASSMFTIIGFASIRKHDAVIFNTIAFSALFMLILNPLFIYDVGFQLSYCALSGIVLFQPKIYEILYLEGFPDKIWSICSVSIAAQLGTFPLGLYYFHQFPNYFILSNIVVIPAASVILTSGIVTIAFSFIPLIHKISSWILDSSISVMCFSLEKIQLLPFSVIADISITFYEMILFFTLISFVCLFWYEMKAGFLTVIFCIVLILSSIELLENWRIATQNRIVVYKIARKGAIDIQYGNKVFSVSTDTLTEKEVTYNLKPYRITNDIKEVVESHREVDRTVRLVELIHDKFKILFIKAGFNLPLTGRKYDYIIVQNNADIDFSMLKLLEAKEVIFDSSNSYYYVNKMKPIADKLNIKSAEVLDKAYIIDL